MVIITKTQLAKKAAEAWKAQYYNRNNGWHSIHKTDTEEMYKKLLALGNDPTPEQINKTIGNDSWTRLTCDECNKEVDLVIRLGQEPNYDSATAYICSTCLLKAVDMVEKSDG